LHNNAIPDRVAFELTKICGLIIHAGAPCVVVQIRPRLEIVTMPYIREHGDQLAIVHGQRNKQTGKVEQRVLFAFYSKKEALAATGNPDVKELSRFRQLMEGTYPALKFNWPHLIKEIEKRVDCLPDQYNKRGSDFARDFDSALSRFAKELILTDPYENTAAKEILNECRGKLEVLRELIDFRLSAAATKTKGKLRVVEDGGIEELVNQQDEFSWHYMLRGTDVPVGIEEWASDLYDKGDLTKAKAIFEILVGSFSNYAEGHNYLGLIALKENRIEDAIAEFEQTMKLGRNLFPRSVPRKDYWSVLGTRPFMRGLMNLIHCFQITEKFGQAAALVDQLDHECGNKDTANVYRASIHLNLGNWQEAYSYANKNMDWAPEEGFIAGFALAEAGDFKKSVEPFVYAALNNPHTARMLLNIPKTESKDAIAIDDHNAGVHLLSTISTYLEKQKGKGYAFLQKLRKDKIFIELLKQIDQHRLTHINSETSTRKNLAEWNRMRQRSFAKEQSKLIVSEILQPTGSLG
jgi:tetratricopeptide (TPR) repeat protein